MTINSINFSMAGSYGAYNQKLTPATRAKLDELGISYDENTTEAQGRKMIQQAEMMKSQKSDNQQAQNDFSGNASAQGYLYEQALALAKELNVQIPSDADFEEILVLIEKALEKEINNAQDNPDKLNQLKQMSSKLASIEAQSKGSTGYDSTNRALMMSLEMLSEYNKQQINYLK